MLPPCGSRGILAATTGTGTGSSSRNNIIINISYAYYYASCSRSVVDVDDIDGGFFWWQQQESSSSWIAFLLFAPCPQHALLALLNSAFLVFQSFRLFYPQSSTAAAIRRRSVLTSPPSSSRGGGGGGWPFIFLLTLFSAAALVTISLALALALAWQLLVAPPAESTTFICETIFSALDAFAWLTSLGLLLGERKRLLPHHPMPLRVWWFASFLLAVLQFLTSAFTVSQQVEGSADLLLMLLAVYPLVRFPILLFLVFVTIGGRTGFLQMKASPQSDLTKPLLRDDEQRTTTTTPPGGGGRGVESTAAAGGVDLQGFSAASVFSKATFSWLTPLLAAGASRSLQVADVPGLSARDTAQNMYHLLRSKWPLDDPSHPHPLRIALLRRFWPQILVTGALQLLRTSAIYVGPLLISSFTSYAAADHAAPFDGYVLVLLLLAAKMVELFAYHHYNFQCYRMGNNVRTAVVTTLYRKGLRLSSAARQSHGVGQITNYMVVDAQQLSDACLQMHAFWSLPLQVIIALVLLYEVMGISAVAGMATMVCIAYITFDLSQRQKASYGLLMKARDVRMKAITEVLAYMKVIKLQAWEEKFEEKVESCRRREFSSLSRFVFVTAISMFTLWNTLPIVSMLTYVIAVLINSGLTTSKVFTAAAIFKIVQEPIRNLPQAAFNVSQVLVCLERLDAYMTSPELDETAVLRSEAVEEYPVVIEGGHFAWNGSTGLEAAAPPPTLQDINLRVKEGSLVTIVGMVGSGKSSLLAAMLGEMVKVSGTARISGRVAYVPQTAWIQNATIKDNIVFGSEWDKKRYQEVVRACALEPDFASMDSGDETEIGERGINLSGGQKQRIQLARAMYQDSDVYLLDDIFSAVDAHTGSHVFKECVLGLLKQKTILLVTHQVEFLSGADLVVVMKEGRIAQSGTYHEILGAGTDFAALVAAHNQSMAAVGRESSPGNNGFDKASVASDHVNNNMVEKRSSSKSLGSLPKLKRPISSEKLPSTDSFTLESTAVPAEGGGGAKLIEDEQRETGRVSWTVYWLYLTKVYGWVMVAALLLNQSVWQASLLGSDYWLSGEVPEEDSTQIINKKRFIVVYVVLNLIAILGILARVILVSKFGLATAQIFFHDMLHSIFRAPMSFFDTTPSGRVLSRFTADQSNVDFFLHFFVGGCISNYFSALGVIIVVSISAWPILLLVLPLSWLYYLCQKFYITSSREMTRLDSITKAPVIYHFSETVAGIETIRCFRKQESFIQRNLERVDTNMKMDFHNLTANEWLGLRLEAIGTAILCTTAFLFVVLPKSLINTDTVALALSYALSLNSSLYATVWLTCTIENKMVSVERIRQFSTIPEEAARHIPDSQPSADWPSKGRIISERLKLRYRPSTPLVLKGVSFAIEGGEKIGVVGRTGSGKSTLILALFRLVEPAGGQILIDEIDISTIGLVDLRQRLGVIPQDPVLFEGTIRANLDPCELYSDEEIWQTLEKCQLAHVIREKPEKLDVSVTEYGGNWSVGQRQLLCFGRALLKRSKILFLDEATASVDTQTDIVIQEIIREEFRGSTVVSIAHRIPSVMNSDRVLVMDAGRVKEFESPSRLLQKESLFASLVREYSTRAERT